MPLQFLLRSWSLCHTLQFVSHVGWGLTTICTQVVLILCRAGDDMPFAIEEMRYLLVSGLGQLYSSS